MKRILLKPTVRINEFTPALLWMFHVLHELAAFSDGEFPDEIVVTSIFDGAHMPESKHYKGLAMDIRSHTFEGTPNKRKFADLYQQMLGAHPISRDAFRVILEDLGNTNEHFHIQVAKGKEFIPR